MTRNPILEELYAAREKLLAAAGGDVRRYLEEVRKRETESGRLLLRSPEQTENGQDAGNSYASGRASATSQ